MADEKGGGSAVLIAVLIGVALALADGGPSSTETTTGTTTGSGSTTTASSGGTVVVTSSTTTAPTPLLSCPGRVVGERTENDITLRVYYDPQARGVNCVSAMHHGAVTSPGYLQTEIRFADYSGDSWPEFASQAGAPGAAEVSGTYLIATDNRCVTAVATYFPTGSGGASSSVSLVGIACG
jgi:hypothetical protein